MEGWMGAAYQAQSELDSAVRRQDAWGRICEILTESFRGRHAVCTCCQQKGTQALSFSKVSSTQNVLDLGFTLRRFQHTLNM